MLNQREMRQARHTDLAGVGALTRKLLLAKTPLGVLDSDDVADSYATWVSSRSLTLIQAGILATITEFIGAIALGQQVTSTIRGGVISIDRFLDSPGV
ncbi:inorganic phosphate transporter [Aspergillus fischeri NRRL 181]|uniref:Uncharacterized protein n=1 Tax=Neosartorya fischeri (strain ATCC 1020 / DSM 3700 / CBS 544.65 / FGSC A1164 / JCM 1740 / NRRL 181 / WB 181) TaxID=331117 RepID=A1DD90_NEOFI|nr:uncharacterized protein NFIA_072610 [Aspergillus fischeri NRRL 181]EAW17347.1 hypothetical protein NFIA_072610 [Aspergillus fischeri NRRL 181]